jgi:hypothetical protein
MPHVLFCKQTDGHHLNLCWKSCTGFLFDSE